MSRVLKLCGALCVLAFAVLASPILKDNLDDAAQSQAVLGGPGNESPSSIPISEAEVPGSESPSSIPISEAEVPGNDSPSSTPISEAEVPTTPVLVTKAAVTPKKRVGKDGEEEEAATVTTATSEILSSTTKPGSTTAPRSKSSLTFPNRISILAALIILLIVKMFGTY